jgi:phosphate transport system substrate-binding protein
VLGDNAGRIEAIVQRPDGITYASVGMAERAAHGGTPIKLLPTEGTAATSRNIRSGDYPLSRPLLLLTHEPPTGLAKAFIDFALSSQVTDLVERHDFIPYLD